MIKAYINDVPYELESHYTITEQLGNKVASEIVIRVDNQPIPQSGDIIAICDEKTMYFLGTCGIPKSPKFSSPYDVRLYSITCANANAILSRRLINVAYKEKTISEIVQALFDKYISAEGFSLGEISNIPIKLQVYTAADYDLQFALDELANFIQGVWLCTNDQKFYFVAREDFPRFPRVIEGDFIPITDLQVTVKETDLRTSQIISGGTAQTQEQSETFTYDAKESNFTLSFAVAQKPRVFVNDMEIPSSKVGVRGINDNDPTYAFLFAYNQNIVTYNKYYVGTDPSPLKEGDKVEIRYIGSFPIRAVVQNTSAINEIATKTGTSGIIDNVKLDKQIKTIDDAVSTANSLLLNFGKTRSEITGWITVKKLQELNVHYKDFELLKMWTFNLPEYGAVGEYVLVERSITPYILDSGIENLKISMKLVDRAFLRSYGEIFNELNKAVSQLGIRVDDIIVDIESAKEDVKFGETQAIQENTSFMPIYCTSEAQFTADGQIVSPLGLSLHAFSSETGG